jgi:type IV pilus assembly protein PilX
MSGSAMKRQHGIALISGLLLLLVITILGISMFRTYGIQGRIAGNTREKQRALHASETAQEYAEWWLSQAGGGNATMGNVCTDVITVLQPTDVQVCSNQLTPSSVVSGPWVSGGKLVGYSYTPPGMGADYVQPPMFYIAYLNGTYDKSSGTFTSNYRINAAGYGGTKNTVAVVESTYQVQVTYTTQTTASKFYSLTGP